MKSPIYVMHLCDTPCVRHAGPLLRHLTWNFSHVAGEIHGWVIYRTHMVSFSILQKNNYYNIYHQRVIQHCLHSERHTLHD